MSPRQLTAPKIRDQLVQFSESAFEIEQRSENLTVITSPFIYPHADPIALYLTRTDHGAFILSDHGDTEYWLNEVNGFDADRELTPDDREFWDLNCELYQTNRNHLDHLETETDPDDIGPAVFRLLQTIIHILGPEPRYDH